MPTANGAIAMRTVTLMGGLERWRVIGITLLAVIAVSVGETLLTKGLKEAGAGPWWRQAAFVVCNRHVLCGIALMAVYFGLYMAALRLAPLSFVLPLTAVSFLLGGLLARFYLHEEVNLMKWIGYAVIIAGVVIVGLGESGIR